MYWKNFKKYFIKHEKNKKSFFPFFVLHERFLLQEFKILQILHGGGDLWNIFCENCLLLANQKVILYSI